MRTREKLTLEEKFALALELIKREHSWGEIQLHYRVSHTTAYKIRNAFLEGGRAALSRGLKWREPAHDLEARVRALEVIVADDGSGRSRRPAIRAAELPARMDNDGNGTAAQPRRLSK